MLDAETVTAWFDQINIWRRAGERAPHKPLLVLYALARLQDGDERLILYSEVEERFGGLLVDFGPKRKTIHPEYPFWRLQNDGLWEIPERELLLKDIEGRPRSGDIPKKILRARKARGGFPAELDAFLRQNPNLVNQIATSILKAHFPSTLHDEILDAVGFPWVVNRKTARDPGFRELVLKIYEHRCAVCGFDGRLGNADLAIEAAHIKWHAAGGPDEPDNGLALCSLHHKVLDRGALGIDDDLRVLISQDVHGHSGTDELLFRYIGGPLRRPQPGSAPPAIANVQWHRREVFRAPARGG